MFGGIDNKMLNETSDFIPKSPYAAAKLFAYNMTKIYRESYGLHAVNGILFNHESPRRGSNFVTGKVTKAAAAIKLGLQDTIELGNLDATRDWGHAKDYVNAMWLMLQDDTPDDYVCSTGVSHSVRDLCNTAFNLVGLNWEDYVRVNKKYLRPEELCNLKGDSTKARAKLKWEPSYNFETMINEMVDHWLVTL